MILQGGNSRNFQIYTNFLHVKVNVLAQPSSTMSLAIENLLNVSESMGLLTKGLPMKRFNSIGLNGTSKMVTRQVSLVHETVEHHI